MPLSAEAARVISTPAFLRLEGIQQLGFVSRIWPGARHTRFEHSLGVMHLMGEALQRLRDGGAPIDDESARTGIAAALLHDIGHYPFSHAIEEIGPPVPGHEQVGREIIESGEIGDLLRSDWRVNPARVGWLIAPHGPPATGGDELVRGLLSGALDVDKLDYLPRDARACHVPYGGVDTQRLLNALRVIDVDGQPRVGIDDKGISPLHSLINARQEMFDNVYWHHTNRACMAMLLRAVQDAVLSGMPAQDLTLHSDYTLLHRLLQEDMPDTTRALVQRLQTRTLYKRAIEISSRAGELYRYLGELFHDQNRRRAVELSMVKALRQQTGLEVGDADILIDIPKPERWTTDVWVQFQTPPVGFTRLMTWHDVAGVSDDTFKSYEEHRRLIRLVVTPALRDAVHQRWDTLLLPLLSAS
jgi:uncharacterized protein